jgi:hypothetical protein
MQEDTFACARVFIARARVFFTRVFSRLISYDGSSHIPLLHSRHPRLLTCMRNRLLTYLHAVSRSHGVSAYSNLIMTCMRVSHQHTRLHATSDTFAIPASKILQLTKHDHVRPKLANTSPVVTSDSFRGFTLADYNDHGGPQRKLPMHGYGATYS